MSATGTNKLNLPALAEAVLTKKIGKRQAFALAQAHYGASILQDELVPEIARCRTRWLPNPGASFETSDGTVYHVALDGSVRRTVTVPK